MTLPPAEYLLEVREQFALRMQPAERQWEYVQAGPDRAIILPTALPPALFRGQNARYSPSLTTLARGLAKQPVLRIAELDLLGQANLADRLIRRLWFCKELEAHPGAQWLSEQKLQGFDFALAQHYGVPTGYMDLSESFDVSCFFATCFIDGDGNWQPCESESGIGVMYSLPTERIPIRPDVLQPIGLQILPRPREQFGWVIACGIGSDFEDVPELEVFEFTHSEAVSQFFFEKFSRGADLFPSDAMADVSKRILGSLALPEELAHSTIRQLCNQEGGLNSPPHDVLAAMHGELGLHLQSSITIFDDQLRAQAIQEWEAGRQHFVRNVGFTLVRSRPSGAA